MQLKKLLVLILLLWSNICYADNLQTNVIMLLVKDYNQTVDTAMLHWNKSTENNIIMGKTPHVDTVKIYFGSVLLLESIAEKYLSNDIMTPVKIGIIIVQLLATVDNQNNNLERFNKPEFNKTVFVWSWSY